MKRRSRDEWITLLQEFESSGLSQADFSQQAGIDPRYFSRRKAQLAQSASSSPFVAVSREASQAGTIQLTHGGSTVTLRSCSPAWLAQLIRELAS